MLRSIRMGSWPLEAILSFKNRSCSPLVSTVPRMTIFLPMTFSHDHFKKVKGDLVSYWATAQKRAPSALREDRKRIVLDLYACDGSIAKNHSDSFVDSKCRDVERISPLSDPRFRIHPMFPICQQKTYRNEGDRGRRVVSRNGMLNQKVPRGSSRDVSLGT